MDPLIVLGIAIGIGVLIFLVGPLLTRNRRKQDTLTKSGRSSSADAVKTPDNGPK